MKNITYLLSVFLSFSMMQLGAQETCEAPSNLAVNEITTDHATLIWDAPTDAPDGYEWVVVEAGGDPNDENDHVSVGNSEIAYGVLTELESITDYEVYLRSNCETENSEWVGPIAFSTVGVGYTCDTALPIYDLPYGISSNTSNFGNLYDNDDNPCASDYMSGNEVFYWYTPAEDIVVDITLSNLDENYAGLHVLDACMEDGASCVAFEGNFTSQEREVEVYMEAGVTYYIVISTGGDVESVNYTLELNESPCPAPMDLTATNITDSSADLNWTAFNTTGEWNIIYGEAGFNQENEGTVVADTDGTPGETITGLNPSTEYEFFVESDCGDVSSEWIGPFAFTTDIEPVIISEETPVLDLYYCYDNDEFSEWLFVSENGNPLEMAVNAGSFGSDELDELIVYDGMDESGAVLFHSDEYDNDLTGTTVEALSGSIYISLTSNESISCVDGNETPLQFSIELMECSEPTSFSVSSSGTEDLELVWDEVSTAVGYEYFIVENGADPIAENYVASGNITDATQTSVIVEELAEDIDYDVYLRVECEEDFYSEWAMVTYANMSIQDDPLQDFTYYPNPVDHTLNLEAANTIEAYKVYNLLGQVIMSQTPETNTTQVNMGNLQSGAYILSVTIGNNTETYRILKK